MVYANDQWIQLPTRDLYDTQVMAMAINAARDMYEKGQQEMKDFQKTYGDFLTPIMADQDWYNQNVTGKVRDAVNALYAQGIDPLRNAQGRAVISQLINNMPYGDIAKKRIRAKNAEEYYKNMAALRLNDKYNEDFSKYLKEDPSQWDPNSAGITSPTAYSDLNAKTSPWFDKVNRNAYLYTKDGYDYFGVKPEDLMQVMNSQIPDFVNSNYGRYQLELARQQVGPNASDAEALEQLKRNIVSANNELTINPTRELNDVAKLELMDKYDARKQRRQFEYNYALQALRNAGKVGTSTTSTNGQDTNNGVTPLQTQIQDSVNQKIQAQMGVGNQDNPKTRQTNVAMIIDYYQNLIDQIAQQKGKRIDDGYEEVTTEYPRGSKMAMTGGLPQFNYEGNVIKKTKKIPKYRYEYSGENDKKYQAYKVKLGQYKRIAETGSPLTPQEQSVMNNIMNKTNSGQKLTDTETRMMNHLTNKMNSFLIDYRDDFYRAKSTISDKKRGPQFAKTNDDFYGMFTFTPGDQAGIKTAVGMLTRYSTSKYKSMNGEYPTIDFSAPGVEYAPIRKANISGPGTYKYNSIQNRFSRWLKGGFAPGILMDNNVQFASIPKVFSSTGESQLDIISNPAITAEALLQFMETLPDTFSTKNDVTETARQLGLIPVSAEGTILNKDKDGYNKATFYKVPTIRTEDNYNGFLFSQMNDQYNIYKYGAATAYKNAINSEAASLTPNTIEEEEYEEEEE